MNCGSAHAGDCEHAWCVHERMYIDTVACASYCVLCYTVLSMRMCSGSTCMHAPDAESAVQEAPQIDALTHTMYTTPEGRLTPCSERGGKVGMSSASSSSAVTSGLNPGSAAFSSSASSESWLAHAGRKRQGKRSLRTRSSTRHDSVIRHPTWCWETDTLSLLLWHSQRQGRLSILRGQHEE